MSVFRILKENETRNISSGFRTFETAVFNFELFLIKKIKV